LRALATGALPPPAYGRWIMLNQIHVPRLA
jgi:hypothetical protein